MPGWASSGPRRCVAVLERELFSCSALSNSVQASSVTCQEPHAVDIDADMTEIRRRLTRRCISNLGIGDPENYARPMRANSFDDIWFARL